MTADIPSTKPPLKIYTIPFEKLSISFTFLVTVMKTEAGLVTVFCTVTVLKMSNWLQFLKTDLNIL